MSTSGCYAWNRPRNSNGADCDDRQRISVSAKVVTFAAWLGVVPEEHSTGGKQTLWQIPLRGNQYLRRLFVQCARAVMQHKTKQSSGLSAWLVQLTARTHNNIAIVALANKLARMAWAVLAKNEVYRPPILVDAIAG